ncbi:MAG: hypothetical protein WC813_04490 [Patescibacteria group bacterium]|jgi:hypothetical protein
MVIYIAHSVSFDYQQDLYEPLKKSALAKEHTFVFPHDGAEEFDSKRLLLGDCDLVIAEVSYPATGVGIELGWADVFEVPIICISKSGTKVAGSLRAVSKTFIEYSTSEELVSKIAENL